MVDATVTPAVAPPATAQVAATTVTPPVEATITSIPDKIQDLIRQIQVNATVTQLPGDGTAILNSIVGPLTVLLPQIADAQQQKLLQQLTNLIQTQRPLTLIIQPGSPPTQAFLFLPPPTTGPAPTTSTPAPTNLVDPTINQAINQPRVSVVPGITLPAIVLPPSQVAQPITTTQPSVPVYIPPSTIPTTGVTSELTPVAAAISELAKDMAPELVNSPAFQELAAKAEITVGQPPAQSVASLPLDPVLQTQNAAPEITTPSAAPVPPASLQSVQQPLSLVPAPTLQAPAPTLVLQTIPVAVSSTTQPPQPTQLAQAPVLALLPSGSEVDLQVNAVLPATTAPINLPIPSPNQILATVTGTGPNGQAVIQAGNTAFYIKQPIDAPIGTNLLLTVEPPKTPALQTLATPDALSFSNLQSTLNTLAQINPQLAQQVLANHIPQATAALPGALLFFMSALKQSNVRTWLGDDAVDALSRAGKFELINKLSQDLANNGQDASDPVVGDWKSYPIPLQNNGQFQIINFYVHGQSERQNEGFSSTEAAKKLHTRFLIDVRMSQLGPMQLDGFIQPRKLDIIVRSEHVLPEGLHSELRQVYTNALGAIDYAGSLNFQVGRHHWLIIQNAKAQTAITT